VPDRRRLEARAPALDLSALTRTSILLVDGHFPAQALRAARRARALGAVVIGDFHRDTAAVRRLLPFVDHPIVPLEFVHSRGSDPRRTLRDLAAAGGGTPVVTLGRRGGIYLERGRVRRFRAFAARVVDTTGAGDVLHGAFAAGLAHGLPFAACLELGARAAARACTALGGTSRLLPRAELLALARRAGARG
jgi:sulfofructose kinase